jgi:glycosyltransferase involved in cell wall biosynthesis
MPPPPVSGGYSCDRKRTWSGRKGLGVAADDLTIHPYSLLCCFVCERSRRASRLSGRFRIAARGAGAVEVSVVIPFRNAAAHIADQLEALTGQNLDREWEVVLVDNGSTDGSVRIAETFANRLNLRIVNAGEAPGAARATNLGVRNSSGEKLVFIDADDQIAPGYLAAMAAALDDHPFVTSAFDHRPLNPEWLQHAHGPVFRDPEQPLFVHFGVMPFAGGSIGIRRSVFEAVGGFPEEFPRMYDIAFSWEVQRTGVTIHYVPEAVYRVRYRNTLQALLRQGYAGGSTAPLLYRRYRNLGMERRRIWTVLLLWLRLVRNLLSARTKADLAPLMIDLGRLAGRLRGSMRHHVFFP